MKSLNCSLNVFYSMKPKITGIPRWTVGVEMEGEFWRLQQFHMNLIQRKEKLTILSSRKQQNILIKSSFSYSVFFHFIFLNCYTEINCFVFFLSTNIVYVHFGLSCTFENQVCLLHRVHVQLVIKVIFLLLRRKMSFLGEECIF